MTTVVNRVPAIAAGARPISNYTWNALRKIGASERVLMNDLDEGDVILSERKTFCILRKHVTIKAGTAMLLRELGTNRVLSTKFEPFRKVNRIVLYPSYETPEGEWSPRQGDVLYFRDNLREPTAAIRHYRGWFRTAAPWVLLSDVEMLSAVHRHKAVIARGASHWDTLQPNTDYRYGSVVATADLNLREPSVWVRTGQDYWTSNSRGAAISDAMVRHEMDRGTYRLLKVVR